MHIAIYDCFILFYCSKFIKSNLKVVIYIYLFNQIYMNMIKISIPSDTNESNTLDDIV